MDPELGPRGTPWIFSLGTRLLGFALLLVVVPAAIFALLTFSSARGALVQSAGRQLTTAAHEAAEHLGGPIQQEQRALDLWRRQPAMQEVERGDPSGTLSLVLASIAEQDGAYRRVEAIGPNDIVVASSEDGRVGTRAEERPWLAAAAAGRSGVWGPVDGDGGGRILHLVAPIEPTARSVAPVGGLHLALAWERIEAQLARSRADLATMGLETQIFLVDDESIIAAANGAKPDSRMATAALAAARQWNPDQDSGFRVDSRDAAVLGVSRPAAGILGWTIVVAQPFDVALAPIHRLQRRWIFVFAIILIAAVAVAGLQGSRMIRPLRDLTAVTRQVALTGRPMPAPDVRREDEIGELAASFTQMSNRLERAQHELVEATRLAMVGELAAGIAHEVRTPLSVLRSSTQMLHRALPADAKNADELARLMLDEIDRLERLVAGLLELARPRPPVRVPTALPDILGPVADLAKTRAKSTGTTIVCTFSGMDVPALCDEDQIRQVVLNLVVNALEHGGPNGRVEIRGVRADGYVGFEVADDGPGIAPEVRDRVFAPFVTTRANGSGLGLAVVKTIVEAHRGEVVLVRAEPGDTVFRVLLPVAEAK